MSFATGIKRAGLFKDNVLMELLTSTEQIEEFHKNEGHLPESLKQELCDFLKNKNPREDQTNSLRKELKQNQFEEKTQPNTLLLAQEAANAPYGEGTGITKEAFVRKAKAKDAETQWESPLKPKQQTNDEGTQV